MKYLEEGSIFSTVQNKFNNDICQNKNVKLSNNRIDSNSNTRISQQKLYILPKEKILKNAIERPLKSPKRIEYANKLFPAQIQKNNVKPVNNHKNNDNIQLLNELGNIYNGFTHKFSNENSSIRAYKTIGHTTLSFASIISMKNRPLLDRKVVSESNLRKKKELKQRQNKIKEQKKKRNMQLNIQQKDQDHQEKIIPPAIDTVHTTNFLQNNAQPVIDNNIKVEIIRTLSVSDTGRLSSESLESLKSVDYNKIEDIINEYLNSPQIPTRYETNEEQFNVLNHLYDAFNYFQKEDLEQYIAWIPINDKKECLSASSLLAKKHAPFVFKKTITHPKRVSSLYAKFIHNDNDITTTSQNTSQEKPQQTTIESVPEEIPINTAINQECIQKPILHVDVNNKPSLNKLNQNSSTNSSKMNTSKSLHSKVVENLIDNKLSKNIKQKSSTKVVTNKKKINTQENNEMEVKPKENKIEIKQQTQETKNKNELKFKPKYKPDNELKSKSVMKKKSKDKRTSDSKIPVLHNTTMDMNNIKLGEYKKNNAMQYIKLNNGKISMIPTLGKFEFPFYHMYDAFETYGKGLLKAPRAWRQLKRNVVSIASIYAYDNRP
ncbi:hypothetical protein BCR36DRAFT_333111 [Piromyces finnis]|uniref:Uncharacterized protein n=1 Tax=Piromyces finnis TaxID=1754191 RepID=A0A1Y1V1R3_9FUNG|nr:hypothetical protein BCR36DRAFT_333111 [Piromyces finnis]|eukprot:ORX45355.1 hypothetical protein BCR36DRAFT_333111 [Piromyces finnis]